MKRATEMKTRLRMLIAEDDPGDVFLLERTFQKIDVAYHHFVEDGLGVIEYLTRKGQFADVMRYPTPNLLLLDLAMPRLDGFGVLQWLQTHPELAVIPTIVFTGYTNPSDIKRAYDLGAHSVFIKPDTGTARNELIETIGSYWIRAQFYDLANNFFESRSK